LCFIYAAGPCQRSLSPVRVPWDSRPYFTISDLRLYFSSPPTTRKVTVEVFDPASTRVAFITESESESYVTTDGQPASLSWNKAPFWGLPPDLYYCLTVAGLLIWGSLSHEKTGLSFTIAAGPRQSNHFVSESHRTRGHTLLSQIGYFIFVAFYDSQDHSGGNRPRLHTGCIYYTKSKLHCD
jgi:hypothetical protein